MAADFDKLYENLNQKKILMLKLFLYSLNILQLSVHYIFFKYFNNNF